MRDQWPTCRLGDVCHIVGGGTPSKARADYYLGEIPWATVRDMQSDVLTVTEHLITAAAVADSATHVIPGGNIVIATRVGLGRVCVLGQDTAINQDLRGIVPKDPDRLSPRYLFWWFKSIAGKIISEGSGATVQGVRRAFVEGLPIRIPPTSEQGRIVALLESAWTSIATSGERTARALQLTTEVLDSHLDEVLERGNSGWSEASLADLCDIKHGFAFSGEYFTSSGDYVLLTPGNFREAGGYRDRGVKQKYYVGPIPAGFILKQGDLLVAMTEQAAGLLGSPILVPESDRFLHNQRLGLVTPKPEVPWVSEFFFHVFNMRRVRNTIHDGASGAKVRHTSPGRIGKIRVRFPASEAEQRATAMNLTRLRTHAQALATNQGRRASLLDQLEDSLLSQAFGAVL